IPIPPLDGSKVLFGLLPSQFDDWRDWMEKNSLIVFMAFLVLEMVFGVFSNVLRLCLGLAINALGIPL
ncbi:site-2 protease family protein, partial [Candidatus Uhrbacteria bacterium]|nr:site-2 protease family protein [Candidatus Uhrbacteria bacterium]